MKKNKGNIFFSWPYINMLFASFVFLPVTAYAQKEKKFIKDGNIQFENKKYEDAQKNYQKALNENKNSYNATFNLGDAYYKQEKYEEAAQQFQTLTHRATSKDTLANTYHNLGNALLKSKKYEESAAAYKNALKNNPYDEDTRYNLAYVQQLLKQQQQQNKDNKDKGKDDNNDKDKKDKNKKDKNKDNQEKEKKQENKKEQQKEKQQQNAISKENAQRLLDALQNDEKNIHNKIKKNKQGVKVDIQKDW